jgi:hypothetical protein
MIILYLFAVFNFINKGNFDIEINFIINKFCASSCGYTKYEIKFY